MRCGEIILHREAADRFDQVLVGGLVARHEFAERGDDLERIGVVGVLQHAMGHVREFEAGKAPARFQHAAEFAQRLVDLDHIADAEGDRHCIGRAIREGERGGIARGARHVAVGGLDAGDQHRLVDVGDDGEGFKVGAAALRDGVRLFLEGAGDIARSSRDINKRLAGLGVQPGDHVGFPDPVNACGHQVVHQVVFRGDGRKHAFDAAGFFVPRSHLRTRRKPCRLPWLRNIGEAVARGYMRGDARIARSRDCSSRTCPRHGR